MEKLELAHKNLDVWILSKTFVKEIYFVTETFPNNELYGLVSQIRRAAVSIVCNISEGSARKSRNERKRFYEISRASLVEIDTLLEISFELTYLTEPSYNKLNASVLPIFKMITKLIQKT